MFFKTALHMNNIFYIVNNIYGGKKNMDNNKSIKCDVESCKYNNASDKYCTLNEIKVSATCDGCDAKKKETICDSFKENK